MKTVMTEEVKESSRCSKELFLTHMLKCNTKKVPRKPKTLLQTTTEPKVINYCKI